jgi:hypothetical protein
VDEGISFRKPWYFQGIRAFLSMIVSTYRPYFAPFSAFFAKASKSDALVLLDSVQFPRGTTWITRNRFKNDQGTLWMTIPVWKKGLGLQKINEVKICREGRWANKHLASLKSAYAKAPFFEDHLTFFRDIFHKEIESLCEFNLEIIRYLMQCFSIQTKLLLLSEMGIESVEPRLSLEICGKLGASVFLAQSSARKYIPERLFRDRAIVLDFFRPQTPVYPQLWGPFLPNLSALDMLFNCGPKIRQMIQTG